MKADRRVCEITSNTVCDAVNGAINVLQESAAIVNGFGILSDVSQTEFALAHARKLIEQAQKAISETRWPTHQDYDKW